MSIIRIEAFSGLSGDMFLGALASLCDAYDEIRELPARLKIGNEAEVQIRDVNKNGIVCRHVKIIDKVRDRDSGHHSHRHLKHIYEIIDRGELTPEAKNIARKIFLELGEAESKVHGVSIEKIHFHEVGAIDSILDIVGSAYLIDKLKITKTYCSVISAGHGFVNTEHGRLPVPTPATLHLLTGFPTISGEAGGELTTPTGAAILRYLSPDFRIPVLIEEKTAYGPGEKDLIIPNTLRISLCRLASQSGQVTVIQTNIDDMSGEYLGIEFQDQLLASGALDFYFEHVTMKKGRPGVVLNVLVKPADRDRIAEFILRQTTSIGLRYFDAGRIELEREIREMDTEYGKVKFKETKVPGNGFRYKPESHDIIRIAEKENKSSIEILSQISKIKKNEND
jgi:pyridinium-3,5-bisthiocarboxylic acid mononucleotide nickel chelatase